MWFLFSRMYFWVISCAYLYDWSIELFVWMFLWKISSISWITLIKMLTLNTGTYKSIKLSIIQHTFRCSSSLFCHHVVQLHDVNFRNEVGDKMVQHSIMSKRMIMIIFNHNRMLQSRLLIKWQTIMLKIYFQNHYRNTNKVCCNMEKPPYASKNDSKYHYQNNHNNNKW